MQMISGVHQCEFVTFVCDLLSSPTTLLAPGPPEVNYR